MRQRVQGADRERGPADRRGRRPDHRSASASWRASASGVGRRPAGGRGDQPDRRGRLLRAHLRALRPAARARLPRQRAPAQRHQRPHPHRRRACARRRRPSACACTSRPTTTGRPDDGPPTARTAAAPVRASPRRAGGRLHDHGPRRGRARLRRRRAAATSTRWRRCGTATSATPGPRSSTPSPAQLGELETHHCFERFSNPRAEELAERLRGPRPGARQPGVPHQRRVGGGRHGAQAQPAGPRPARRARAHRRGQPRAELPRRQRRRDGAHRPAAQPGRASARASPTSCTSTRTTSTACARCSSRHPGRVAAVFAEPVIGAGGVWPPAPGYLEGLRALCDEHGAHLVLDEVITGFGRLGSWFGGQHYGVPRRPDDLRQGRHQRLRPARRGAARAVGARAAVGRPGVRPAPRLHLLRARDRLRRRARLPRRHGAGGPARPRDGDRRAARRRPARAARRRPGRRRARRRRRLGASACPRAPTRSPSATGSSTSASSCGPIAPATLAICPPLVITDEELDEVVDALRTALTG